MSEDFTDIVDIRPWARLRDLAQEEFERATRRLDRAYAHPERYSDAQWNRVVLDFADARRQYLWAEEQLDDRIPRSARTAAGRRGWKAMQQARQEKVDLELKRDTYGEPEPSEADPEDRDDKEKMDLEERRAMKLRLQGAVESGKELSYSDGESDNAGDDADDDSEDDASQGDDDGTADSDAGPEKKGKRNKASMAKPFGAGESTGSEGGRSVFGGVVGGFGPWVNPGRQGRGRSTGGGRVLETRGDLAPWVYGDPRGGGRSGGRGALRDVGLDPWTNPKRDDDYGDGGRGAFPVDPGTDPVAGFRNVARASRSSQSSLALAMGIHPAALEDFE